MDSVILLFLLISINVSYATELPECKKTHCIDYEVIESTDNYEMRRYGWQRMVTIRRKGVGFRSAHYFNFYDLNEYISGKNDRKSKFNLTLPIINIMEIDENSGEMIKNQAEMGLFLPEMDEENVPKPLNKQIEVVEFGPTVYAVRFHGFPFIETIEKYQKKLHDDLKRAGVDFDESYFMVAEYNHASQVLDRYTDVMYMSYE